MSSADNARLPVGHPYSLGGSFLVRPLVGVPSPCRALLSLLFVPSVIPMNTGAEAIESALKLARK
ncbi:hypothetical protein K438DRAFT_1967952 [Mycena galopus ATCC 62051]|nr:hypothetical protein K438DRAFT_1967952 [Mycena galopus ATCC 62051]